MDSNSDFDNDWDVAMKRLNEEEQHKNNNNRNDYGDQCLIVHCDENWDDFDRLNLSEPTQEQSSSQDVAKQTVLENSKKAKKRVSIEVAKSDEQNKTSKKLKLNCKQIPDGNVPEKSIEGWVLFATSLHEEASEHEIKEMFSDYGEVLNVHVNPCRRTGFMEGYAMVQFGSYEEALNAKQNLNGAEFLGMKISVNWCFTKNPKD